MHGLVVFHFENGVSLVIYQLWCLSNFPFMWKDCCISSTLAKRIFWIPLHTYKNHVDFQATNAACNIYFLQNDVRGKHMFPEIFYCFLHDSKFGNYISVFPACNWIIFPNLLWQKSSKKVFTTESMADNTPSQKKTGFYSFNTSNLHFILWIVLFNASYHFVIFWTIATQCIALKTGDAVGVTSSTFSVSRVGGDIDA